MNTPTETEIEFPPPNDAEVHATAWALDQLDPEERAAFEKEMAADPALAAYAREMRAFCAAVSEEMPADDARFTLEENRRAPVIKALAQSHGLGRVVRGNFLQRHWRGLALLSSAACLALALRPLWMEHNLVENAKRGGSQSYERMATLGDSAQKADEALLTQDPASGPQKPKPDTSIAWTSQPGAIRTYSASQTDQNKVFKLYNERGGKMDQYAVESRSLSSAASAGSTDRNDALAGRSSASSAFPEAVPGAAAARIRGSANPSDYAYEKESLSYRRRVVAPTEPESKLASSLSASSKAPENYYRGAQDSLAPADLDTSAAGARLSTESYQSLPVNPFLDVTATPLSTFSIDVDTASYANVRRFLNAGNRPPAEAVRLEELVNYFPYDEPPPVDGKPFAVRVNVVSAPWNAQHRLARIVLKGKEIAAAERPASNLVFLVDVSGSMNEPNKLPLVQQSLRLLTERLTENDRVSLVTYAGNTRVVLPSTNGQNKKQILAAIDSLSSGGGTNGAGGIAMAYKQAADNFIREGVNRVILATDGDFNIGVTSRDDLLSLITEKAKSGVFLSVLGYGMGNLKDDTMELLSDKGNGNYAYIDSLSEARKSLVEQMSGTLVTIAKDVKIQIEFNPSVVRSYKLLGYENRLLAKEDFNDDKKDAGEIGAGHTVTALYEIVPANTPELPVNAEVDGLKYQKSPAVIAPKPEANPAADSGEMMTVKLRWKQPKGETSELMEVPVKDSGSSLDQASGETRWAVAVAGFAQLLRQGGGGATNGALTWESVRQLARGAKGADPLGYRGEFLQLIDKAESLSR